MWETFFGKSKQGRESIVAADDAQDFADRAPELVDAAAGTSWYTEPGNPVDVAVVALCLLRRAAGGDRASIEGGDAAVREVLAVAQPESLVWLVSRQISYMDENGFPELVEPWMAREAGPQ
jgi:hypothetical protein